MSLKIWLPLNGDVNQQGISNIAVTQLAGVTANTAGKIGKCMSFNGGSTGYLHMPAILTATDNFSICFWMKLNNNTGNHCLYSQRAGTNANGFTIFYISDSGIRFDDGSSLIMGSALNANQWYHVTCCRDNDKKYIYIDGILNKSGTRTSTNASKINTNYSIIGGSQNNAAGNNPNGNYFNGYLNDYRIYNHCLSAAEVKEIAQGLVLHYKLNGGLFGNANELKNSTGNLNNTTNWGGNVRVGTNESTPYLITFRTNTTSSSRSFISQTQLQNRISWAIPGTNFTISGYYKVPSDEEYNVTANMFVRWVHTTDASSYTDTGWYTPTAENVIKDQWIYFEKHYVVPSSYSNGNVTFYLSGFSKGLSTVYWKNIKLEQGTAATPWCPHDDEMNINRTIIEDSSGYNHNGSILNEVIISSDTPRYDCSTNLVAGNSAINCGRGGMVTDSITVNFWLKSFAWANPVSCTQNGGWNFEASDDCFRFSINISGVGYKYGKSTTTKAELCNNQWHMLTGVYDRINGHVKIYVDGELDNDYNANTNNSILYHSSNVIWLGAEASSSSINIASNGMAGLFSDFRIYCTPLLDTDIKQLYNVGMKVDNFNNLYTEEIIEKNNNIFSRENVLKYRKVGASCEEIFYKNGKSCVKMWPAHFYKNITINDTLSSCILYNELKPNTQYVIDLWMDSSESTSIGGVSVTYDDGTNTGTALYVPANDANGWLHRRIITSADKSVVRISQRYGDNAPIYISLDSYIAPIDSLKIKKSAQVETTTTFEDYDNTKIFKSGDIKVKQIIER